MNTSFPTFKFIEFNQRRAARGADAARVEVTYSSEPGDSELLWMTRDDIMENLESFGDCTELQKALSAYSNKQTP